MHDAGRNDTADSMAEMGAQQAAAPRNAAERRARYFNSANAFNIKLPAVPARAFDDVAARALAPGMPTGWYACDQSGALRCDCVATTPLMLARYARINAQQQLHLHGLCSGVICYVIQGQGRAGTVTEQLHWETGDVILFAGGQDVVFSAADGDAVLWVVTDEPLYAHCRAVPPADCGVVPTVHYRNADIDAQLQLIQYKTPEATTSGCAVVFSSEQLQASRNLLPTLTLSLNSLRGHCDQQPHRHNSAAITLVVSGQACHTTIDGQPVPWQPWSTLVTPAAAAHSHHNRGEDLARFLIVQDGGLYYHARTMGFQFLG
ncbi:hypothetical protein AAV94_03865 [Lampropedia cohaerens]|uniref:Cupin type-2 domain-containing protein n=2 Tax=Lampropedia cohaerens TaxID=1610491 RepID=A0A0U1Q1P9_9BURK|nr:hypothetical protein AAV94_03865 [Lampropedia cohaerens]